MLLRVVLTRSSIGLWRRLDSRFICVFSAASWRKPAPSQLSPPRSNPRRTRKPSQTSVSPKRLAKERARLLYEKGVSAYREGRFYDAVDIFLETNRIYPDPKFSYNIG